MHDRDTLIIATGVGKKFCRGLKRSLWYGALDIAAELGGRRGSSELRTDEFWALRDVSFSLQRGECLALIGANGAGKSTLLKLLNGIIKPDTGRIEMRGRVGALIELGAGFDPILTGRENIYNRGSLLGFSTEEINQRFDDIVEFAEIGDFLDMPVRNYSSGMKVRLGFAVSAQMDPDILLVDEVLSVGDIGFRLKCLNAISRLLDRTACILVSHSMPNVARVATKGIHLRHGAVRYDSPEIGLVIDDYFKEFGTETYRESGSGKASLRRIALASRGRLSGAADDPLTIDHDEPLELEIDLSFRAEISTATVKLIFMTQEMRPVAESHSDLVGFLVENRHSVNRVRVVLPRIPFNSGLHSISVVVVEARPQRAECFLRVDNAATFRVRTFATCWADSILPSEWHQLPAPEAMPESQA